MGTGQILPLGPADKIIAGGGGTPSRLSSPIIRASSVPRTMASRTESTSGPVASSPTDKLGLQRPARNARVYAYIAGITDGLFSNSLDQGWQRQNVGAAALSVGQYGFGQSTVAVKPGSPQTLFLGTWASWRSARTTAATPGHTQPGARPKSRPARWRSIPSTRPSCSAGIEQEQRPFASREPLSQHRRRGHAEYAQHELPRLHGPAPHVDPANRDRLFAAGLPGLPSGRTRWSVSLSELVVSPGRNPSPACDVRDVAIDPSDSNRVIRRNGARPSGKLTTAVSPSRRIPRSPQSARCKRAQPPSIPSA